jgi:hypothetical protein
VSNWDCIPKDVSSKSGGKGSAAGHWSKTVAVARDLKNQKIFRTVFKLNWSSF